MPEINAIQNTSDTRIKPKFQLPEKWDYDADVVILGTGGGGLVSAITAHDQGASVLLLEKTSESREGGNTRVSQNGFFCPTNIPQGIEYLKACCKETTPDDVIRTFIEYLADNIAWIQSMGGEVVTLRKGRENAEFPDLPGADCFTSSYVGPASNELGGMAGLWRLLKANVVKRGIKIIYETPAKKLIQNPATLEIMGVVAEKQGTHKELHIKAKKAVIMACGGFEFNTEMMRNYFVQGAPIYSIGTPSNTGDGIKMVEEVGAELWHMSNVLAPSYELHFSDAGLPLGQCMYFYAPSDSLIWVDKIGNRWRNDEPPRGANSRHGKAIQEGLYHDRNGFYPRIPTYVIFDEATRTAGPLQAQPNNKRTTFGLFGYTQFFRDYEWSPDNTKEIARGWILKANTIKELALKIKRDPDNEGRMDSDTLENTVSRYNQYCKSGTDPEFGRASKTLMPIKTPPFYSCKLWPRATNTQGGPKHDKHRRAMHISGKPVPRLYTAGEFGSVWGWLYQAGGNVGECIASGRIAGEHAAAEKPWI
ncbi:MAG: FAD-binding protein [Dehalococcoidales bacterium]|nr:FAD-binding protein [Dehalococcoidales bacterium]